MTAQDKVIKSKLVSLELEKQLDKEFLARKVMSFRFEDNYLFNELYRAYGKEGLRDKNSEKPNVNNCVKPEIGVRIRQIALYDDGTHRDYIAGDGLFHMGNDFQDKMFTMDFNWEDIMGEYGDEIYCIDVVGNESNHINFKLNIRNQVFSLKNSEVMLDRGGNK